MFRALAGGAQLLTGTTHNEAEHKQLKRWCQNVLQQHRDRLEIVSEVYSLYRLMTNHYKNNRCSDSANLSEREIACLLAGRIASGGLRSTGAPLSVLSEREAPASREQLYVARVKVDEAVKESQSQRAGLRSEAWARQGQLDVKRGRRKLTKRIHCKSTPSTNTLKWTHAKKRGPQRDSAAIMAAVQGNIPMRSHES